LKPAFGIPIVSECLRLRAEGVAGIKALIVYPMNALANSQYDDFARRLAGSGLKLALYTGDTLTNPEKALEVFRQITGREEPYDSELISREAIKNNPPDILMTNYVMLGTVAEQSESRLVPKLHAFFSQGRTITACLTSCSKTSQRTWRANLPHLRQ